ncbi:MAG: PilZ domain-containing protein [Candidatus Omnitrophota bacterium]|nr:MAG: PilZ domain-containing protein [Candidatus Omnitrophota bacterium]
MFTKEDYKNYFMQIGRLEGMMIYAVQDAVANIEDSDLKNTLSKIADNEAEHYSYIRDIFAKLLLRSEDDRRRHIREYFLGKAVVKASNGEKEIKALCVDVSEGGICLEYNDFLSIGKKVSLEISLYGQKNIIRRNGVLIWYKEIEPGAYIGKIEFRK